MIINGRSLVFASPIKNMETTKKTFKGVSHGLTEAGYDLRLAETVLFIAEGGCNTVVVNGEDKKGRFTLASAMEEFHMPTNLVGVVHDKSTHARRGLSVFNTVIESGWKGFLTLELVFHGQGELLIPAGTGIAQVLFSSIKEDSSYSGKYQSQEPGAQRARYE